MSPAAQITLALLLDGLVGDPRWLPHPVRLMARLAQRAEGLCRRRLPERAAGIGTVVLVLAATTLAGWGLIRGAGLVHPLAGDAAAVYLCFTCFAARDLFAHSRRVAAALRDDDLVRARTAVAMLVGRETAALDQAGVVRACVESVAENTVDGVTAPLFWAAVGGPVAALAYKAASTMDSLFGYKNERNLRFGWAPARLDDVLSWLPARLTGMTMVAAALLLNLRPQESWRIFWRDRLNHASPNSGHTEAAAAGALAIRLGGPARYHGLVVAKPFIGDDGAVPETAHIHRVNRLLLATTLLFALALLGIRTAVASLFT